ncbi:DNA recombination protein RmuC [Aridibaculum aurantiacum]|uniref:DNA recombination protein RmuC n=1 Tax=Aridibaculum aurantiacum TaxID=2810307 RepID=UPI001A96FADA|nr:DNA recombination protein RmuC [Aridibaculum aurantiacum]
MEVYILIAAMAIAVTAVVAYLLHNASVSKTVAAANEHIRQQELALQQAKQEKQQALANVNELLQRANKAESQNELLKQQYVAYTQLQEQHQQALSQVADLTANLKYMREKLDLQQNEMLRLREQFKLEFGEISNRILNEQSLRFTQANEEKLKLLLDPLKENLVAFKQKVEETYDKESKERFSLEKEVHRLVEMSKQVSQEANNLTTALKGNNKLQGNWGEMILEGLLENSGLTKGREFAVQEYIRDAAGNVIKDEQGKGLQPDIIIYYPDQRRVIIDSKVSLVAWEQCIGCDDKEQQVAFLKEHIRSVKQHIDGLSRKNYPKYAGALDYVLLFIPIEPAFLEAIKADVQLWKYAYDKKILLVSPTNLFSVLKIIADLWKVEQQQKHAVDIAEKAGALYEKFCGFIDNMELVGKRLAEANNSYNEAFKQLATGRGNLVNRVEELKKMGAKTAKQLPEKYLALE